MAVFLDVGKRYDITMARDENYCDNYYDNVKVLACYGNWVKIDEDGEEKFVNLLYATEITVNTDEEKTERKKEKKRSNGMLKSLFQCNDESDRYDE